MQSLQQKNRLPGACTADAVEFRLDFTEEPLVALEDYDGGLPIVATNRIE